MGYREHLSLWGGGWDFCLDHSVPASTVVTYPIREREAWLPPTPEEDIPWRGFGEWAPEWAAKGVAGGRRNHGLAQERPGNLSHCRQPLEGHSTCRGSFAYTSQCSEVSRGLNWSVTCSGKWGGVLNAWPVRPDHRCSEQCLLLCSFLLPHFILLSDDSGDFCSRFIFNLGGGWGSGKTKSV